MSPTIPPILVLSLLLVSPPHTAEAGELMDLLALIRGTLKYWRRVYHMYEEEVALGYCWAEYFLHLHGEETVASSPGHVLPDHAPHHDFQSDFGAGFANGFGDGVEIGAWNGWIVGEGYRRGKRSPGKSRRDEVLRILDSDRGVYSNIFDGNGFGNERLGEGYRGKRSLEKSRRDEVSRILDNDRGVFVNENETRRGWIIGVDNGKNRSVYSKIEGNERIVDNDGKYRGKRSYGASRRNELLRILNDRGVFVNENETWRGWIIGVDNGKDLDKDRSVYSKIKGNSFENERIVDNDGKYRGKISYGASRRDELLRILNDRGVFVNGFGNETWRRWIIGMDNGKDLGKNRSVYSKIEGNERIVDNDGKYRGKISYGASRRNELLRILNNDNFVNGFKNHIENETWIIGVDNGKDYRSTKRSYKSLGILGKDRSVYSKIEGNETWNERFVTNDGNYRSNKRSYDARRDGSLEVLSKNRDIYSKIDENAFENNFEDGIENGEWIKRSYGTWKRKDESLGILNENRGSVRSRIVENDFGDEGRNDWTITTNNKRKYNENKTSYGEKEGEILESLERKDYNNVYWKIVKELVSGGSMSDESVLNFKKVFDDELKKHDETLNFTKKEYLLSELAKKSSMIVSMENGIPTTTNPIQDSNLKKRKTWTKNSSISRINFESAVTRPKSNKRNSLASISSEERDFPGDVPSSNEQRATIEQISRTIIAEKFLDTHFVADHANLKPNRISNRSNLERDKNENPTNYERSARNPRYSSGTPSPRTKEILSSSKIPGRGGRGGAVPTSVEGTTKFRSNGVKNSGESKGEKLSKGIITEEVGRERRDADEGGERRRPSCGKAKEKTLDVRFDSTMRGCRKAGFSIDPSSSVNRLGEREEQGYPRSSRGRDSSVSKWRNALGQLFPSVNKPQHGSVSRFLPNEKIVSNSRNLEKEMASNEIRRSPVKGNLRHKRDANHDRTTGGASRPCNPSTFHETRGSPRQNVQKISKRAEEIETQDSSKGRHDGRDVETTFGRHRGTRTASLTPDDPRGTVFLRLKNSSRRWKKREGGGPRGEKQSSSDVRRDNSWYGGGDDRGKSRKKSRTRGLSWLPSPVVGHRRRFTEDYGVDRWRAVDQGRRRSSRVEARGLDRGDTALFYLRQAFMGFLRALGFFVNVGRQLMDYVESNGALACTKDYLVGKAIHWIDS
ncbi:hypothetical protein HZU73_09201 [Apis mellifera caucasica]|nr:hypothetical protein HZU73_09201 [Apis mellifera caucasica]